MAVHRKRQLPRSVTVSFRWLKVEQMRNIPCKGCDHVIGLLDSGWCVYIPGGHHSLESGKAQGRRDGLRQARAAHAKLHEEEDHAE